MLKLEIKLDDKQIIADGKYTCEKVYDAIDKAFSTFQFRKEIYEDGTICYYGNGKPRDFGGFGRLITSLKDREWFMEYLIKWIWYNSDNGRNEEDYAVNDVLYHYTKKESVS